jgi:hypothetical protein
MSAVEVLTPPHPASVLPVAAVLQTGLLGRATDRKFAVPSAGGLFPYDLDMIVDGAGYSEQHLSVTLPTLADRLPAIAALSPFRLTITLNFLPEVSLRKYGDRGVTYGLHDCGHVLANLKLAAHCLGFSCHHRPLPFETSFECAAALPEKVPVFCLEIGRDTPDAAPWNNRHDKGRLLEAMRQRTSARSFSIRTCDSETVALALESAAALCRTLNAETAACSYQLAQRHGENDWALSQARDLEGPFLTGSQPVQFPVASLFCGQGFTEQASAILMVSVPLGPSRQILAQSLLLGQLGQALYLSAGLHRLAACCVGGFHYGAARDAFKPPAGHYVSYAMLLGHAGAGGIKVDRRSRPSPRDAIVSFPFFARSQPDAKP